MTIHLVVMVKDAAKGIEPCPAGDSDATWKKRRVPRLLYDASVTG